MNTAVNIVVVGSGKVAAHLTPALSASGHKVIQVVGRNEASVSAISKSIPCPYTTDFSQVSTDAHLVILAVSDSAIAEVAEKIPSGKYTVAHVSGATPIAALSRFSNHGVMYFLQSFVPHKKPDFRNMPVLINGSTEEVRDFLRHVASGLSDKCVMVSDHQREVVHVAAVFANNFSNHMLTIAEDILKENNLDLEVLKPLVFESIDRLRVANPSEIQTGPAVRGDYQTMKKHLELLNTEEKKDLYERISKSIQHRHSEEL